MTCLQAFVNVSLLKPTCILLVVLYMTNNPCICSLLLRDNIKIRSSSSSHSQFFFFFLSASPLVLLRPQVEGHGLIRAVNSYAGFTEFDRTPAFLHPDSSKFEKENYKLDLLVQCPPFSGNNDVAMISDGLLCLCSSDKEGQE